MRHVYILCSAAIVIWSTFIHYTVAVCGKYTRDTDKNAALVSTKHLLEKFECGRPRSYLDGDDRRIVNGQISREHEYPWMALILYYNNRIRSTHHCGGSVINNYYILTAGHCVMLDRYKIRDMRVALGVHDRITLDHGEARIYRIAKIIRHPSYAKRFVDIGDRVSYTINDVALFRLHKEIIFGYYVRPICLPNKGDGFANWNAIVIGWGLNETIGVLARFLKEATVNVLSYRECAATASGVVYKTISSQIVCAAEENVDSCQGDSGGPLMVETDVHLMVQIGIVSFGLDDCASPDHPGMYAKVSNYVDWIYRMTTDAKYCKKPAYRHRHRSNVSRRNMISDVYYMH